MYVFFKCLFMWLFMGFFVEVVWFKKLYVWYVNVFVLLELLSGMGCLYIMILYALSLKGAVLEFLLSMVSVLKEEVKVCSLFVL